MCCTCGYKVLLLMQYGIQMKVTNIVSLEVRVLIRFTRLFFSNAFELDLNICDKILFECLVYA